MSRYVDIDFILDETDEFGYENGFLYGLSGNSAPSIDICFCHECKYTDGKPPIADGRLWCRKHYAYMYYCSDGERSSE